MKASDEKKIQVSKLLCDPTRYTMLRALLQAEEGLCVYEIAEAAEVSQSAASHQLAKLEAHEVVESYRSGQTVCYLFRDDSELGPYVQSVLTLDA